MKKNILISLVLSTLVCLPQAYAKDVGTTLGECLKGDLDLDAFSQTIISQHGFTEGVIEYWKDIIGRNDCQSFDILALDNQLDRIKKRIQDAFLTCKRDKIPALENAYYKIDAEMFYNRRLVPTSVLNESLALGIVSVKIEDLAPVPSEKIYAEMLPVYKDRLGGTAEFDKFFQSLEVKYANRKFTYIYCPNDYWNEVSDKFKEFADNWGGLKSGTNAIVKSVEREAERIKRTANTRPPSDFKGFLQNSIDMSINNLAPGESIDEILKYGSKYMPGWTPSASTGDTQKAASASAEANKRNIDFAKMRAKYEALYRRNTDSSVMEFLDALDEFGKALDDTSSVYLNGVFQCTTKILNKQCQ